MTDTELSCAQESCPSCADAGLLVCTCAYYRDWKTERPTTIRPWMGRNATLFAFGHRTGRADCARRLWQHLTPEGKQLATSIAAEGEHD